MQEYDISTLDKTMQTYLENHPFARDVYETTGLGPRILSEEENQRFKEGIEKMMRELEPIFEKYDRARARSWINARETMLD